MCNTYTLFKFAVLSKDHVEFSNETFFQLLCVQYHSWNPPLGPSKNLVTRQGEGDTKSFARTGEKTWKGGVDVEMKGGAGRGVATFLLIYSSTTFTECVCVGGGGRGE